MQCKDELCIAFKCDAITGGPAITFAFQKALFAKTKSEMRRFPPPTLLIKGDAKYDAIGNPSKCLLNQDKKGGFSVQQRH
jgi:hypothetical protein